MLAYALKRDSQSPLYTQLYSLLRRDIEQDRLKAGERLPGAKAFAQQLGVSKITVENAYQQLAAEGYISSVSRGGHYVERVNAPVGNESAFSSSPKPPETRSPNLKYEIDFAENAADPSLFPASVWARLTRAAITEHAHDLSKNSDPQGLYELREAICALLYRSKGINAAPEQVFIGAGSEYLFNMLIQFLGRDRLCAVENPGYPLVKRILGLNGVRCAPIRMDAHGVRMDLLRKSGADALVCAPSHHFPTGIVTPIGKRREILRWAAEGDRCVIENDFDSEFRLIGMPIPALSSIDENGHAIYVNTFSKSIAPSIRVSYMVLPEKMARDYADKLGFYKCTAPALEQYVLERFLTLGYFDSHIQRAKRAYKARRDRVIDVIRHSAFNNRVTIKEANAGLHFLLSVDTQASDSRLKWALRQAGVRVYCLSDYALDGAYASEHTLIVNYSNVDVEALEGAIGRIEGVLSEI